MTRRRKNRFDFKFILLIVLLIAVLVLSSFFIEGRHGSQTIIDITDLPDINSITDVNKLIISEIVSSNSGIYLNDSNQPVDFIELYNGTDEDINLSGYGLSDTKEKVKFAFGNVTIPSKGYIVVNLTGKEGGSDLDAAFKLSSKGGEDVILVNSFGKVIDGITTVAMSKNYSLNRTAEGKWAICQYATPGFENTITGLQQYHDSLVSEEESPIVINEFLPRNNGNYQNENGRYDGFIELKNVSNKDVNLKNYSLSNDINIPFKYQFADKILKPGEIYVVYTDSTSDYTADNYTSFTLAKKTGSVILGNNGKIVSNISYANLANGLAYVRTDSGDYSISGIVSAGYENTSEGIEQFQKKYMPFKEGLIINEVMSDNSKYLAQNSNHYYDWIELYNNSDQTIMLSDYCLSKDDDDLGCYRLPEVQLGPYQLYVIMCSGDTSLTNKTYYHANFKIGENDAIFLSSNNKIIDSVFISNLALNSSYGRDGDGGYYYSTSPTPLAANNGGNRKVTESPVFSVNGGVYNDIDYLLVELSADGTIYYTTDGSIPTTSSKKYDSPLKLTKTTVIKARSYNKNETLSEMVVNSYIINENHTMPVISVSLNPQDYNSIVYNAWVTDYEEQAYVEFYEDGSSFSVPCSLSLFGGSARGLVKKSYALRFDRQWGAASLHYDLFDNRDNACYDAIVLRCGSQDQDRAVVRDILGCSLLSEYTSVDTQDYKPAILYVNGQYHGIYNIREKVNRKFVENHYNVDTSSLNLINVGTGASVGTYADYGALRSFVRNNDMAIEKNYDYVASKIDMVNLCDFWIAESFVTNNDLVNCRFFSCDEIEDGKLHYIFYDLDWAWYNYTYNFYTLYLTNDEGLGLLSSQGFENDIIKNLFRSEKFCDLWLERLAYNLNNTWSLENINKRLDEIMECYAPEIKRDRDRWGFSMQEYNEDVAYIREYSQKRVGYLLSSTKSFFNLSNSEMKEYFGDLW